MLTGPIPYPLWTSHLLSLPYGTTPGPGCFFIQGSLTPSEGKKEEAPYNVLKSRSNPPFCNFCRWSGTLPVR